jgi:hypothetical protein
MKKYLIEVDVHIDHLHKYKVAEREKYDADEENIPCLIFQEMSWVHESGIYVTAVSELPETDTITIDNLGIEISEIINQDGDEKTDGECIDKIINLLNKHGLYKKRV